MRDWKGKRYWLVGASEGLGAALARVMSRAGVRLVLSARSKDKLRELADSLPGPADIQVMDVSDKRSVTAAAAAVGPVDGVIYLAGLYWPMAAGEWDTDKAEAMADVNFTGCVRVMGAVVPPMVERDTGHVVITGSLAGFRGLPGAISYAASKAGVMSLAESMYADLRGSGVDVQLVNPGFIQTRLTDKNDFRMPFIMTADIAARHVFDHMTTRRFQSSFPGIFAMFFRLGRLLPDWLYYRLFA